MQIREAMCMRSRDTALSKVERDLAFNFPHAAQASLRRHMSREHDNLPHLVVVQDAPRSRHPRGKDSVIDDLLQLTIAIVLYLL